MKPRAPTAGVPEKVLRKRELRRISAEKNREKNRARSYAWYHGKSADEKRKVREAADLRLTPEERADKEAKKKAYDKARYAKNPNPARERANKHREKNVDEVRRRGREYYRQNRARLLEYRRDRRVTWVDPNPDRTRGLARQRYIKNRGVLLERSKKWRQQNAGKVRGYWNSRRATALQQLHRDHDPSAEATLIRAARAIARDTGVAQHVDHIIPLSFGGFHHHDNLQILPARMNESKNEDTLWEKPGFRSWRDVPEHLWPLQLVSKYRSLLGRDPPNPIFSNVYRF
jgi:hypothetical protein